MILKKLFPKNSFQKFYYTTITRQNEKGEKQIYLVGDNNKEISFWNDVPLQTDKYRNSDIYNICIEIPKFNIAKLEVDKSSKNHPIIQDKRKNKITKQEELRFYAQFPLFNYGFLPQTWESPFVENEGFKGDDDPLDVVDLSSTEAKVGQIYEAKVLGCICLIDQGEIDWKIFTISKEESERKNINSIEDFEKQDPGRLNAIKHWFKFIKVYDGKKQNFIHYNEQIFGPEKSIEVIQEMHKEWSTLKEGKTEQYNQIKQEFLFE
uniref:inorganic diphosphatase n=1 Tax=Philasterides dicentrarchi TaxID=282688 RepID=A0A481XSI8_9CILI|nr:cytoplasmic inorganic pyrophosphatase family protein [Philasterides dicentrarchi]